jgi:23S rRNA (uracil1939-C5)-methyltransferase
VAPGRACGGYAVTSVRIRGIAAGGDGVGRLEDGIAIFVPRSAPDDVLTVEVTERKARYARGRIRRIDAPGGDRVDPGCPHYERDACGGCQLQHLAPHTQLEVKRRLVGEALRRLGKREVEDPTIVPSPLQWRYRTKITLAVSDGRERIGLHPWDRPGHVFELNDCRITTAPVMGLWGELRACRALLPEAISHLVLREDRDGGPHVVVRGGEPPWDARPLAHALSGGPRSIWWEPAGGKARVVAGPRTGFPPLAFAQVNASLADSIRGAAVEALGPVGGRTIWDLYGGVGDGSRLLAAAGARVWSVDADRAAVEWAVRHAAPVGAPAGSPTYLAGRVEEVLQRLPTPDAVLLNPPRTGAAPRVLAALERHRAEGRARRVAYVSCDPATLARDLARLTGYRVARVVAYDLFPQTSHVETLAVLEAT